MENKINIAELLKDCPKGMELDCTIWDSDVKVFFKEVLNDNFTYPVVVIMKYNNIEYTKSFTKYGSFNDHPYCKCVIFPKGKTTWEGFVPPCQFKNGDIITDRGIGSVCIFKSEGRIKGTVDFYCGVDNCNNELLIKNIKRPDGHFGDIIKYDFATEEEKAKLFDAIKANGYKWNPETKTLEKLPKFKVGNIVRCINNIDSKFKITGIADNYYICENNFRIYFKFQEYWELIPNKFDIGTLKPFDKVLVRTDPYAPIWTIDFYDGYNPNAGIKDRPFGVSGGKYFQQCIPYEGNEHLRGTTNDCDDFYKIWEE